VTLNVATWLLLFTTTSEYEPAENPAGRVATSRRFVNDARVSVVVANTTFGASPDGLKLAPLMVMWLFEVFTTVL